MEVETRRQIKNEREGINVRENKRESKKVTIGSIGKICM